MNLADRLAAAIGLGVLRVLGIARQTIVGAFRGALLTAYRAAAIPAAVAVLTGATPSRPASAAMEIVGWVWTSRADASVCVVCWAQHGTVHPLDEEMVSHRNCRCVARPYRRGDPQPKTGVALFAGLTEGERREILGPGKAELYESGRLRLGALVTETDHPEWGRGLRETTLRELTA